MMKRNAATIAIPMGKQIHALCTNPAMMKQTKEIAATETA
jgi:hypothetical protein